MQRIFVETAATDPLIALEAAKRHCRVEHGEDDEYIAGLVATAGAWLEGPTGWLGRSLLSRTLRLERAAFGTGVGMTLSAGPVTAIEAVTYIDANGATQTLDEAAYFLAGDATLVYAPSFAAPSVYPRPDAVRITYVAGYANEAALPLPIRQAILLLVGHWYENREAVSAATVGKLPFAVEALLSPWRVW